VLNTDADQIIIADAGPHPAGGLLRLPMSPAVWKTPIFAKRCATSLRVARKHSANVRGAYASGLSDNEEEGRLNLAAKCSISAQDYSR